MSEAQIGLALMLGAAVFMGAVIGFRLNKREGSGYYVGIYGGFWGYIFYVGALMLASAAKAARAEYFFITYPLSTVLAGILVVAISTVLWSVLIFLFNRFVRWYHPRIVGK